MKEIGPSASKSFAVLLLMPVLCREAQCVRCPPLNWCNYSPDDHSGSFPPSIKPGATGISEVEVERAGGSVKVPSGNAIDQWPSMLSGTHGFPCCSTCSPHVGLV